MLRRLWDRLDGGARTGRSKAPPWRTPRAQPRASVVVTVYRDMRFLDDAVGSVLSQDFPDLELIVVDDGNARPEIFDDLARRDDRIRVVTCPVNVGAAAAANRGIAAARSDIVVRLDADDLCEPQRVGRLVGELDRDAALGLLGSDVLLVREDGTPRRPVRMPRSDLEIRWTILFHNPFYHSAVAFRRRLFDEVGGYREHERVSQDHYLWFDLLGRCRARNLPEPLTRYRLNPQGLTALNNVRPRERTHAIRERLWADIGLTYDLHGDAPALDLSAFLRGKTLPPERRRAAYARLDEACAAFLSGSEARRDPETRAEGARLRDALRARMAHEPPEPQRSDRAP